MRNMKLRLISAVLATCMMASVLPASAVTAFADDANGNTTATTPAEDPMGTLIEDNNTASITIATPGIYQIKGTYNAPIDVNCGDVTINITGNVIYTGASTPEMYWAKNYAIRVINDSGVVTINNNGHTVTLQGDGSTDNTRRLGFVRVDGHENGKASSVVVTGGSYQIENIGNGKEIFYNYQGNMTLANVNAEGEISVKNNGGTTIINNSSFARVTKTSDMPHTSVYGAITNTMGGVLTLNNVNASATQGMALSNMSGTITVNGGVFSTKDNEYSAILANKDNEDGEPTVGATIEINGAKVKDSARGIDVKEDANIVLKNATFENNDSDICLSEDQKLEDVVDTTDYSGTKFTVAKTDESGKSEQYTMANLNVEGAVVTVDGKEAARNGDTVSVTIAEKTPVTIAYNETAYKDSNLKFSGWTIEGLANAEDYKNQQTFTFEMPADTVTIKAGTATADTEDDSWDAATVVTGVAIGAGAAVLTYHIGTELYAKQVLGDGVAVPKTREDVALKAWELAGKPAVELNGEPLSEAAQAEKWAVESGLMQNDATGEFNGAKKMNKLKALRTLDAAKKLA